MADQRRISEWLVESVAELLRLPTDEVPTDVPFTALGLSSMQTVELSDTLQRWAGVELSPTAAYDYPAIDDISAHVAGLAAEHGAERSTEHTAEPVRAASPTTEQYPLAGPASGAAPIAIVGIGCRVPGADGPEEFWQLLTEGVDAIREVPAGRWDARPSMTPTPPSPAG